MKDKFKKWLNHEPSFDTDIKFSINVSKSDPSQENKFVESRIGVEHLKKHIQSYNSLDPNKIAQLSVEFKNNGGVIKESKDLIYLIETKLGSFNLPRTYVKAKTSD